MTNFWVETKCATLMHSFKDARNLIDYSRAGFNLLKLEYGYCTNTKTITPGLPVMIKNFLQNARSALDFSAHALYREVNGHPTQPATIRFPYAWFGATEMEFEKNFDVNLPGVKINRPDVYDVLNSYQYYNSDDNAWLPELMELINDKKYANLIIESIEDVDQFVGDFGAKGAGLIIRGEGTIEMGENARIESQYGSISGEQIISMKTAAFKNKERAVNSRVEKHSLIYFDTTGQEVIDFLSEVLHGVSLITGDLEKLADQS